MLRTAAPGIATGIMLAVARVAGRNCARCFSPRSTTASGRGWLNEPHRLLPVNIYTYAVSPYEDWHEQAWAAALVLVTLVMVLNLIRAHCSCVTE